MQIYDMEFFWIHLSLDNIPFKSKMRISEQILWQIDCSFLRDVASSKERIVSVRLKLHTRHQSHMTLDPCDATFDQWRWFSRCYKKLAILRHALVLDLKTHRKWIFIKGRHFCLLPCLSQEVEFLCKRKISKRLKRKQWSSRGRHLIQVTEEKGAEE